MKRDRNARETARLAGARYYSTGLPCKNGHTAARATVSGACTVCTNLAAAAWKLRHPERARANTYKWREEHIEKVRALDAIASKARRGTNPEKVKAGRSAQYRKKVADTEGREVKAFNRTPIAEFVQRLQATHAGALLYVGGFSNMNTRATFVCTVHSREVEALPSNTLGGANPCPQCNHLSSKAETSVAEFLAQHTTVEQRVRGILGKKEIDVWLPEFQLGVEYHGLYWHTEDRKSAQMGHREKWELAQKAGIRLVQVFEDEWVEKQEIVKARLLAFIGKAETYNARALELAEVSSVDGRAFLEATHIQGGGIAAKYYALCEGDVIRAVASFGKARSGAMTGAKKAGAWEVVRYASTGRVRGGFSRLLKHFMDDVQPLELVSYCDLRYGDGKLYAATGFTLEAITEPDYWWVPRGALERVPRYTTQKHRLAKTTHPLHQFYAPDKTENEICEEAGWKKIYGVGSQRWVWRKQTP